MANTVTFEMKETEVRKFENLIDETLTVLRRMEKESPEREAKIAETQTEIQRIKAEIQEQLKVLKERERNTQISIAE